MKLFGSSGIRGLANREVGVDLALRIGEIVGAANSNVVIGRDPRISALMIEKALAAALSSAGCNVTLAGLVTTPTLAFASRDYDCGIMVTASHNPSEYVGIKLWNPDGMAFDSAQQTEIENKFPEPMNERVKWNEIGAIEEKSGFVEQHCRQILKNTNSSKLRVVLDCGCGAGSTITPYLLRRMGCEVITLNSQPDGYFPARNPEPNEKNLWMLQKAVREFDADLGIAHDGDADRMMAVDDEGTFVTGDEMLTLFALQECEKNDTIAVPVDTSMMLDDALPEATIVRTRVGDVYVAESIKKHNASFGGEPSGSWIFPAISYCPDGIYAAGRLVNMADENRLSDLRKSLPQYPTVRGTIACEDSKKENVMMKLISSLKSMGEVSDIDGIRVELEDGWVLVRPSGTEPKIRITAEARSGAETMYKEIEHMVQEALH
ncbi:phosphoglucosamine mutase [Methanohalophilus levihalophilus]|uniref:phosphoglucosamine mutase n=1 Tax=Methanohalophilus levihalophilus TaxID=1431282 RepID=UPI001AE5E675|nr:phosphoglucosamine mutase [Methanohalophilus levihalophilus]MBP2031078.1 phosphoglucosamine mutase [Methanohalophilus levihalophilus]